MHNVFANHRPVQDLKSPLLYLIPNQNRYAHKAIRFCKDDGEMLNNQEAKGLVIGFDNALAMVQFVNISFANELDCC